MLTNSFSVKLQFSYLDLSNNHKLFLLHQCYETYKEKE